MSDAIQRLLRADPVRYMGTDGMKAAAQSLREALECTGYRVHEQVVNYDGWHELGTPHALVYAGPDRLRMDAKTMIYSPPIDVDGVLVGAGRQMLIGVFHWRHFSVMKDGDLVAQLIATDEGPSVPLSLEGPGMDVPSFIIGAEEGDALEGILDANGVGDIRIRLCTETELLPDQEFSNIVGSVRSDFPHEVLICAHYDSIYDSPGANDNGSGLICASMVAEELLQLPEFQNLKITVAFFGGEELLQLGSKAYLKERIDDQTVGQIALVVNLDMVGVGEYFWPWVDPGTEPALRRALAQHLCQYPVKILNPPLAGDHYPFYEWGIPVSCLIWWPDPNYHLPSDVFACLDPGRLSYTARLCVALVREFFSRS